MLLMKLKDLRMDNTITLQDPFAQPPAYGFGELFRFKNPYTRQRYWATGILAFLANIGISFVLGLVAALLPIIFAVIGIVALTVGWILFATTIKRLRDAGISLWWVLLTFVPVVNLVTIIVFGCIGSGEPKNTKSAKAVVITYLAMMVGFFVLSLGFFGLVGMHVAKGIEAKNIHMDADVKGAEELAIEPHDPSAPAVEPANEVPATEPADDMPATVPMDEVPVTAPASN